MSPKIKVKRTLTFTEEVPIDEEYYPGMSQEQAEEYEKKMEFPEVLELMEQVDPDRVTIQTEVTIINEGVTWEDMKNKTWDQVS